LHASPNGAVAPTGGAIGDASCVTPGSKDTVGSPPAVGEAPAVGSENVGRETGVLVESGVGDGAASAVCVNCTDNCAMTVSAAAVLIALASAVGAGVAPPPHEARKRAAVNMLNRICRGNFRTNIIYLREYTVMNRDWKYLYPKYFQYDYIAVSSVV